MVMTDPNIDTTQATTATAGLTDDAHVNDATERTDGQTDTDPVTDPTLVPIARPGGPRIREGKAWEPTNSDGSINPGSFDSLAGIASVELAHEVLHAAMRANGTDRTEDGEPALPDMRRVMWLARRLLHAADTVQAAIRHDGWVDRADGSHSRARGAIRFACEAIPMNLDDDADGRALWVQAIIDRARCIAFAGVQLASEPAFYAAPNLRIADEASE